MAVYAVGDLQGCFRQFRQLLEQLDFSPSRDRLWLAGDLVGRGPDALATLRYVMALDGAAQCVLGNHDLNLLAVAEGRAPLKPKDRLDLLLAAPDRDRLLQWLRRQALLIHDESLGFTMVHAGLAPQWDLATARRCANEVESALQSADYPEVLSHLYGNRPDRWSESLRGWERLRFITNFLTRVRFCTRDGRMDLKVKAQPGTQPEHLLPWFALPERATRNERIIFGHWSTLGVYRGHGVLGLDSGCVWGGHLSAARIDMQEPKLQHIDCPQHLAPG